jgi:Fibronectin type III domain
MRPIIGMAPALTAIVLVAGLGTPALAAIPAPVAAASRAAAVAPNLAVDALTTTWANKSDAGSAGNPAPTTTADCGEWSGGDGTQVAALNDGSKLWTFSDTYLGAAVARQQFFNNSFIRNSMVRQNGSTLTTITGGTQCANGTTTGAATPITPPAGSPAGDVDWAASSISYGSSLVKFYYRASGLLQQGPQVVEIPQSALESGSTISRATTALDGCLPGAIMWGAATVSYGGYTYIYGGQTGNNTGSGPLYLARTSGDPANQGSWSYYTGGGNFTAPGTGQTCGSLPLAAVGDLKVATEFSVAVVGGALWLVQDDPASGTYPGWAVAHQAAQPWGFTSAASAAAAFFQPGVTTFAGIDDSIPDRYTYAARLLDPAAVTASTPGDLVIAYNINSSAVDPGCVSLLTYDANAYRPRFIDVPAADFTPGLAATRAAASASAAAARRAAGRAGVPPAAGRAGAPPAARRGVPAPPVVSRAVRTAGAAQLAKLRQRAPAAAAYSYNPDAVPAGTTWGATCPSAYAAVGPHLTVTTEPDGSLQLTWPNQGADVWYWVWWQDLTTGSGWQQQTFWALGPNADSWDPARVLGLPFSDTSTIQYHYVPASPAHNGDRFSFWVQAFAAGNGSVTSPDSAATATSAVAASVAAVTGLAGATDSSGHGVTLTWNAVPALPGETVLYDVYYKLATSSTWTELGTPAGSPTVDVTPLSPGTYNFKVAAVNDIGEGPATTTTAST